MSVAAEDKQAIKQYYDSTTATWQDLDGEIPRRYLASLMPLLGRISQDLPARNRAIDVGCGGGRYTQLLCEFFGKVIGYDFSERLIEAGRQTFPEIQFEVADAKNLPAPDASAEFVMSVGLTECLDEAGIEKYIKEMARVLAPGGMCLFRMWRNKSIPALLARFGYGMAGAYPEFYFQSLAEIRRVMRHNGFEKIRFVGALLVARWWMFDHWTGKLTWTPPVRKTLLFLERYIRRLPLYETHWVIARKKADA